MSLDPQNSTDGEGPSTMWHRVYQWKTMEPERYDKLSSKATVWPWASLPKDLSFSPLDTLLSRGDCTASECLLCVQCHLRCLGLFLCLDHTELLVVCWELVQTCFFPSHLHSLAFTHGGGGELSASCFFLSLWGNGWDATLGRPQYIRQKLKKGRNVIISVAVKIWNDN